MDGESPGNFGLMDQSAALLWLKKNIKNFGGNENTITLMGHGAGAVSTTLHLTSKEWSESLFNKAIIMSGNSLLDTTVRPASFYAGALDRTATAFGCFRRPTSKLLDCLRRVSAKILVETAPDQNWGPILDEGLSNLTAAFISASPTTLIEHELLRKVPIMIGFTDMEDAYDVMAPDMMNKGISNEMYDSLLNDHVAADFAKSDTNDSMECSSNNNQVAMESVNFLYKPYPPTKDPITLRQHYLEFINDRKYLAPTILLAAHMSKQSDTYVYRFDIKPRTMLDLLPEWMGVPHGFEQIFVWGLPYWGTQNEIAWDNADKRVSDIIMTMWANFAKHTNPTQVGVYIRWETFTHDSPNLLIIDRSFNMSDSSTLNYRAIQFWNDYYPSVLAFSTQCCNMTDNEGGAGSRIIPNSSIYLIALLLPLLPFFFLHILPLT